MLSDFNAQVLIVALFKRAILLRESLRGRLDFVDLFAASEALLFMLTNNFVQRAVRVEAFDLLAHCDVVRSSRVKYIRVDLCEHWVSLSDASLVRVEESGLIAHAEERVVGRIALTSDVFGCSVCKQELFSFGVVDHDALLKVVQDLLVADAQDFCFDKSHAHLGDDNVRANQNEDEQDHAEKHLGELRAERLFFVKDNPA